MHAHLAIPDHVSFVLAMRFSSNTVSKPSNHFHGHSSQHSEWCTIMNVEDCCGCAHARCHPTPTPPIMPNVTPPHIHPIPDRHITHTHTFTTTIHSRPYLLCLLLMRMLIQGPHTTPHLANPALLMPTGPTLTFLSNC